MIYFCVVLVFLALLLDFVSAPTYGTLCVVIAVCDLTAISCLLRLDRIGSVRECVNGLLGLVAVYTLIDVFLRMVAGVRAFDVFV